MQRGDLIVTRTVKHHFNLTPGEWMHYVHPDKKGFFVFLLLGDVTGDASSLDANQMLIDLGWTPPKKPNQYEG